METNKKFLVIYSVINTPVYHYEWGDEMEVNIYQAMFKNLLQTVRYIKSFELNTEIKFNRRVLPKAVLKKFIESDKACGNVPVATYKAENISDPILKTKDCWFKITMFKIEI